MINTIMRNMISNAIKFTPKGGKIFISIRKDADNCIFSVKDTGIGVNKDELTKILKFEGNYLQPNTGDTKSTGLGLLICKEFLDLHRGELKVESEPPNGSTFSFIIPLQFKEGHDIRPD